MPRYTYEGDVPRSLPEFGIDYVGPGDTVDTGELVIDNPAFKRVREEPKNNKEAKEPKAAAEAPKAAEKKE